MATYVKGVNISGKTKLSERRLRNRKCQANKHTKLV